MHFHGEAVGEITQVAISECKGSLVVGRFVEGIKRRPIPRRGGVGNLKSSWADEIRLGQFSWCSMMIGLARVVIASQGQLDFGKLNNGRRGGEDIGLPGSGGDGGWKCAFNSVCDGLCGIGQGAALARGWARAMSAESFVG